MIKLMIVFIGVSAFLVLILVIALLKRLYLSDKSNQDNIPQSNIPEYNNDSGDIETPILTNHASMRMQERLGVCGNAQIALMNEAFKYGRTADRSNGDIRIKLEDAQRKYDEETVAKFHKGSIFIFTAEDNILKTVYPFDNHKYLN